MASSAKDPSAEAVKPAGYLAPWKIADLPEPPLPTLRNVLLTIGPGFIALMLSIGSGEWLMGPKLVVEYGPTIMWVNFVSCWLQLMQNFSYSRYGLYTGEGVITGFNRLWPGPRLWGPIWLVLLFLSVSTGWAMSSATAVSAMILGRLPGAEDWMLTVTIGSILVLLVLLICTVGKSVEITLERFGWFACLLIIISMVIFNAAFVPLEKWVSLAAGWFQFGAMPSHIATGKPLDPILLGGFAGYSGAGGYLNTIMSNWFKDKGYGMGGKVGRISGLIGGEKVEVSEIGMIFPLTAENLRRWKSWIRYMQIDQVFITWLGWLIGMYICCLYAYGVIPPGTILAPWAIAAYQGTYTMKFLGYFGWAYILFIGFWVLFTTQLGGTEAFVRQCTDLFWVVSKTTREKICKGDIRRVYYLIFGLITIYFIITTAIVAAPLYLIYLIANMANVVFVTAGIQVLALHYLWIPKECRPRIHEPIFVVLSIIFFWYFSILAFRAQFGDVGFWGIQLFYVFFIIMTAYACYVEKKKAAKTAS
jgi:hypothetical protein